MTRFTDNELNEAKLFKPFNFDVARSVSLADKTMQPIRRRLIEIKSLHVMYYRLIDRSMGF